MDIIHISQQILKNEPQPPKTIQLMLVDKSSDLNMIYEISSLFLFEAINEKIIKNLSKSEEENFIENKITLLKEYFDSIGVKLNIEKLKGLKNVTMKNIPSFYNKVKYPFTFCFTVNQIRKKKNYTFYYNPYKQKLKDIKEGTLYLNIKDQYFKVTYDFF
jgi:hypothetical protein